MTEEGISPDDWLRRLRPFVGGPAAFQRERAPHLLISPAALKGARLVTSGDALSFRFELPDGRVLDRTITAIPGPANGPPPGDPEAASRWRNRWPQRELSPVPFPGDARPWVRLAQAERIPLYLSRPDDFYWKAYLPEQRALYVQINATEDQRGREPLTDFLAAAVADARDRRVRDIIVDLRFNPGGDATKANAFAEAAPKALPPDGRLFIITSGNSFSAAIITAARLKAFGGHRAVIVGERIGDDEQFWAEGHDVVLPNSRILIKSTAAYHDWANGCGLAELGRCYFFNYVWGVAAGDLSPTIPAALSMADYRAGRDPALAAIALPHTIPQRYQRKEGESRGSLFRALHEVSIRLPSWAPGGPIGAH
ncbi:hypothetical protein [Phenylobacterium sp.]|uniref:hypothetical protein n=1 Tax=Phenylobacterium sp. TaxID=1871053 RepID=UPI002ED7ABFE